MNKGLKTLQREAQAAADKLAKRRAKWYDQRVEFDTEANDLIARSSKAEDEFRSDMAVLQERADTFNKAVKLAEAGMDPIIAKMTAPDVLRDEADQQRHLDDFFRSVFDNK